MPRPVPEELRERKFQLGPNGLCTTELKNGRVVEFQTFGELNPESWMLSMIEYIHGVLPALESDETVLTPMPHFTDGRVTFAITPKWTGWGRETIDDSGRRVFTIFSGGQS
jgi:hypothetical protein